MFLEVSQVDATTAKVLQQQLIHMHTQQLQPLSRGVETKTSNTLSDDAQGVRHNSCTIRQQGPTVLSWGEALCPIMSSPSALTSQ
jgi:hypothetical protein